MNNRTFLPSLLLVTLLSSVLAAASPDSDSNPQTGCVEIASERWDGSEHNIIYTIDRSGLPPITIDLTSGTADDIDPRLAIASSGSAWVVWTQDGTTGTVLSRTRDSSSTWGSIRQLSDTSEDSRNASIVFDGSSAWAAYEIYDSTGTSMAVVSVSDEPTPIPQRVIVSKTEWTGDPGLSIHGESGHLWVTWVHTDSLVGYSEYSYATETWASPSHESYSNSDVDTVLTEIRERILGL